MASVATGSKLLVYGASMPVVLRSLRAVELDGGWSVPVMGDATSLRAIGNINGTPLIEFPTEHGPVRLDAELIREKGQFMVRAPGLRTAAMVEQRRENVRGLIHLPLRGVVLSVTSSPTRSQAAAQSLGSAGSAGLALEGVTSTVSGGGISAHLRAQIGFRPGMKIYVELGMPGGDLAPAVLTLLEHDGPRVRARFIDISTLDREKLVRLVFARQRAELAERRLSDEDR